MVALSPVERDTTARGRRVEIIGVFGSGKTTLAKRLGESEAFVLAENHERNPFWGDERAIKNLGYIGYDLSFLLQHAHLVAGAPTNGVMMCDWSFASDRLWASMRLGTEREAYDAVYRAVVERLGNPAGYLFLRQSPQTILRRIESRSRQAEQSFRDYVAHACVSLDLLVEELPPDRVLTVGDDIEKREVVEWLTRLSEKPSNA